VILAIQHLVAQTLFAKNATKPARAAVYLNTLVILTLAVGQSVFKIPIAIDQRHASITSAKIHVQEYVE